MKVVALTGGVGGAKFVRGLHLAGLGGDLTAIVNTGDDFTHLGLHVSPDIDTLLYTLAGLSNRTLGWGREGESWNFMAALKSVGGPDWFNLGDGDLALHVLRTHRLTGGETLSSIVSDYARAWGIEANILPMSDDPVRTVCHTQEGPLAFQEYFVREQCRPAMQRIIFEGAGEARATPGVIDAIVSAEAIFVAPSNPYLSVDPILAVSEIREALNSASAPVVVISPIVGGKAVKGPTSKLMHELGLEPSNDTIADHYGSLADAMVHDPSDAAPQSLTALAIDTMMRSDADKLRVARAAMDFAATLR